MNKVTIICTLALIAGVLTKVETVTYNNGRIIQRVYDKHSDVIPSDIIILAIGRPYPKVNPSQVIEHREVLLSNYWQKPGIA